jgi:hypothetical protein
VTATETLALVRDMIDNARAAIEGERFYDDFDHDEPAADQLAGLARVSDALHELRGLAARLEHDARHQGATFARIAAATGTTTQSAQERHARRLEHGHKPDPVPGHPTAVDPSRPLALDNPCRSCGASIESYCDCGGS